MLVPGPADRLDLVELDHAALTDEEIDARHIRAQVGRELLRAPLDGREIVAHEARGLLVVLLVDHAVQVPAVAVAVDLPGAGVDAAAALVAAHHPDVEELPPDDERLRLERLRAVPAGLEDLLHDDPRLQ